MGEQATKIRNPSERSRTEARGMSAKVAAWINEARHERSLVGPGAHRMAYRHMLRKETGEDVYGSEPAEDGARAYEETVAPTRERARPNLRLAPRLRAAHHHRFPGGERTLFAVSAVAVALAAGPLGYLLVAPGDLPAAVDREPERLAAAAVLEPASPKADIAPPLAAVQALAPSVRAAERRSLAVTEITKDEPKSAFDGVAHTASLSVRPADRKPTVEALKAPLPDPRAEALLAKGKDLMELGEVAGARAFFERAAELGLKAGWVELARTYDPVALKELKVVGLKAEPDKAIALYDKARMAGEGEAANGLIGLAASLGR